MSARDELGNPRGPTRELKHSRVRWSDRDLAQGIRRQTAVRFQKLRERETAGRLLFPVDQHETKGRKLLLDLRGEFEKVEISDLVGDGVPHGSGHFDELENFQVAVRR